MNTSSPIRDLLRRVRNAWSVRRRIRGLGHRVECRGAALRDVEFDIDGEAHHIFIAPGAALRGVRIYLRGKGHVLHIESGVRFARSGELWMEDEGGQLRIGRGSTFEGAHLAVTEPGRILSIGEDCQFAYGIDVRTGDSHPIVDAESGARLNPAQDVLIGPHVWVGAHASILRGARIEAHSVVATRAVVTAGDYPSHAVLAGVPARVVRVGVSWRRDRTP